MLVILLYFYEGYQLMYIDKYNIKVKKLYIYDIREYKSTKEIRSY